MIVVTWNVHWCRGIDGKVDPDRIARVARQFAAFDVLCLQEIAVNFPGLAGSRGEDQVAALAAALPGFAAVFGAATEVGDGHGATRQFGNAIFTRLAVLQVYRHLLPWPADSAVPNMQRLALEVVLQAPFGAMRVVSTHLEYFSAVQRMAQVDALLRLHTQACEHAGRVRPSTAPGEPFDPMPHPRSALICGDFNFKPNDAEHARMTTSLGTTVPRLVDAWAVAHPLETHEPTVGVHEEVGGPFCGDFIFVSDDLAPRVHAMAVELETDASVHQPVSLELTD